MCAMQAATEASLTFKLQKRQQKSATQDQHRELSLKFPISFSSGFLQENNAFFDKPQDALECLQANSLSPTFVFFQLRYHIGKESLTVERNQRVKNSDVFARYQQSQPWEMLIEDFEIQRGVPFEIKLKLKGAQLILENARITIVDQNIRKSTSSPQTFAFMFDPEMRVEEEQPDFSDFPKQLLQKPQEKSAARPAPMTAIKFAYDPFRKTNATRKVKPFKRPAATEQIDGGELSQDKQKYQYHDSYLDRKLSLAKANNKSVQIIARDSFKNVDKDNDNNGIFQFLEDEEPAKKKDLEAVEIPQLTEEALKQQPPKEIVFKKIAKFKSNKKKQKTTPVAKKTLEQAIAEAQAVEEEDNLIRPDILQKQIEVLEDNIVEQARRLENEKIDRFLAQYEQDDIGNDEYSNAGAETEQNTCATPSPATTSHKHHSVHPLHKRPQQPHNISQKYSKAPRHKLRIDPKMVSEKLYDFLEEEKLEGSSVNAAPQQAEPNPEDFIHEEYSRENRRKRLAMLDFDNL